MNVLLNCSGCTTSSTTEGTTTTRTRTSSTSTTVPLMHHLRLALLSGRQPCPLPIVAQHRLRHSCLQVWSHALWVEAKLIINGRASAFLKSYSEDLLRVYPQANSDIEIQKHTALLVSLYL